MRAIKLYLAFVIISSFALSSCGVRGALETAPPVFGPAKAKYEAEKAQKAEEERIAQESQTKATPK